MQSKLRLSEAILLGSTMIKPKRGIIFDYHTEADLTRKPAGCALGMAYTAAGYTSRADIDSAIWHTLTRRAFFPCRCYPSGILYQVQTIITHLFDAHVVLEGDQPTRIPWTLEQLVDWVRSVETEHADEQWAKHAKLTEEAVAV